MVELSLSGVFPAPRETLLKVLALHLDDEAVRRIHPDMAWQRTIRRDGAKVIVERLWRIGRRPWKATWSLELRAPESYSYEVLESDGILEKGFRVDNAYAVVPEGTLITTRAAATMRGVPGFLQGWLLRRALNDADDADLAFLRASNL